MTIADLVLLSLFMNCNAMCNSVYASYQWLSDTLFAINPGPAGPGYTLPLQTMNIQISWPLKKPSDLDLHCLSLGM